MDRPADLPSDFGNLAAAERGETSPPPAPPSPAQGAAPSGPGRRFTVESGRSKGFASAAERIGSHGLEVVHAAERSDKTREERYDHPSPEHDVAARMMQEIEQAVAEIRRHAAGRLISLQRLDEPPAQRGPQRARFWHARAEERPAQCGVLSKFLSRIQERVCLLASEKPMQTAAALIAAGLAFGAALLLRKFQR